MNLKNYFNGKEAEFLRRLAALIIAADQDLGLPAADDPQIFENLLQRLEPQQEVLAKNMQKLFDEWGGLSKILALPDKEFDQLAVSLSERSDQFLTQFISTLALAYYKDERVLNALGVQLASPFPAGAQLEQGDWSLLDSVAARTPFYRRASDT